MFDIPKFLVPPGEPAHATLSNETSWVPLSEARAFKPIRFFAENKGYAALMRVDPGTTIPPHRHTGEVHALTLEGQRALSSGELIGPGDCVYEPAGSIDSWGAVGDEPVIVFIIVWGSVEYLSDSGEVTARFCAETQEAAYRRHCEANDLVPLDLVN